MYFFWPKFDRRAFNSSTKYSNNTTGNIEQDSNMVTTVKLVLWIAKTEKSDAATTTPAVTAEFFVGILICSAGENCKYKAAIIQAATKGTSKSPRAFSQISNCLLNLLKWGLLILSQYTITNFHSELLRWSREYRYPGSLE